MERFITIDTVIFFGVEWEYFIAGGYYDGELYFFYFIGDDAT
jgi:hypothetical protein